MNSITYRIHLEPEPEGGFAVTVPALPGCVTWGRDYAHALEMAQDAIQCYFTSLVKDGLPIRKKVYEWNFFLAIFDCR